MFSSLDFEGFLIVIAGIGALVVIVMIGRYLYRRLARAGPQTPRQINLPLRRYLRE